MALPQAPAIVAANSLKFKSKDLQSITFRWWQIADNVLRVQGAFSPRRTYFCQKLSYHMSGDVENTNGMSLLITTTANPAAALSTGQIGTTLFEKRGRTVQGEVDFDPNGWYLPVGKSIYIMAEADASFFTYDATNGLQNVVAPWGCNGGVTLYLLETHEQ